MDLLFIILFALNYMQVCLLIGYKKFFNLRQTIFLTSYLILLIAFTWLFMKFTNFNMPFMFLFIQFMIIQLFFIYSFLKNWILTAFYFLIEIALMILAWLITWDFLNFLWMYKIIPSTLFESLIPTALFFQQLFLFIFLFLTKKINAKYQIYEAMLHIQKKYRIQSIASLALFCSLVILRHIDSKTFESGRFFYLTGLLLVLSAAYSYVAYLIGHSYQQQQQISILSKKTVQDSEKISLANEFKHDYRNILLSLKNHLDHNQDDQARHYLDSIIQYSAPFTETDYFTQISMITIPPVQGTLINFFEMCATKNIPFQISVNQSISYTDISIHLIDFIRCLSILLDNAVEASLEVDNPLIQVTIERRDNFLFVEVKNVSNNTVSLERIFENHFTTKEGHQGKGIPIFIKQLKQYRETSFMFDQADDFFVASFSLPRAE